MEQRYFDFYNIAENGNEDVNYDIPEIPVYIRRSKLSILKDYTFKAHYHNDWEFIYAVSGNMKYSINGKVIVLKEGESLFVNSNNIHFGFSDTKEDCDYICLIVHPMLFCNNPFIERNYIMPIANCGYEYLIIEDNEFINTIINTYDKKQSNTDNLYFDIQQDLFSLASRLYSLIEKLPKVHKGKQTSSSIKQMLDYIADNYGEKISLSDIAKSGNVCNNSCIKIFQKFTSETPMDYLNRYRIEKARNLLVTTNKTVSEIAFDCGFSGSSYFSKIFKGYTGITPREYKKKA